jgi:hypothetical protein
VGLIGLPSEGKKKADLAILLSFSLSSLLPSTQHATATESTTINKRVGKIGVYPG